MTTTLAKKYKKIGSSTTTPHENKKRKEIKIKEPKKENIIFIGSEMQYNIFWLKMMFISAAYVMASNEKNFRPADRKIIAFVDNGYSRAEKLTINFLQDNKGFKIVKLSNSQSIIDLFNKDRGEYKLQDVAFFSHGIVGEIDLNYNGSEDVKLTLENYSSVNRNVFMPDGRLYSYACRTGIFEENYVLDYNSDEDAKPELSLAQRMASHFKIEVHAFLTRTYYGGVLREAAQSATISATLKQAREGKEGQIIEIPPDHEALPHDGLGEKWLRNSAENEGTNDYALWRKEGGISLPIGIESPKGLSTSMRKFTPVI